MTDDPQWTEGDWYDVVDTGFRTPCFIWKRALDSNGRPYVRKTARGNVSPVRDLYEREHGVVPDRFDMHHLCEQKRCINQTHVTPRSKAEHQRVEHHVRARPTHCKRGHRLSGDNVYYHDGRRLCRTCRALHRERYRRRH